MVAVGSEELIRDNFFFIDAIVPVKFFEECFG